MDVKVYTSPTCPWCKKTKEFLSKEGVKFEEVDVTQDPEALDELVRIAGVRSVPVTTCGNDVLVGYDPDRLQSIVNCARQHSEV
jgi:glutaredoxin-like YruB-family protein